MKTTTDELHAQAIALLKEHSKLASKIRPLKERMAAIESEVKAINAQLFPVARAEDVKP